jgi:putative ABC transport system permease protein
MHNKNGHGAGDTDHKLNPHGHDDQHEIATDKQDEHREQAHHHDHDAHHEQGDHDGHADHEAQSEHDHHEAPTSPYDKPHTQAPHQQLENENKHHLDGDRQDNAEPVESGQEVTLLLVTLASPMGVLTLPRAVNAEPGLQAASPAYELTRLLQIVGIGVSWLNAFAIVLVISAALSIFAALYASLRTRRHDLAVLRCLGASRRELFLLLLAEGFLLTTAGIIAGLCLAHGGMTLLGQWLGDAQGLNITGWTWAQEEFWLVLGLLSTGIFTAIIPAWQAYQTDVARTLSSP